MNAYIANLQLLTIAGAGGASSIAGLEIKYVYGLVLLALAAVLVIAQVWTTLHPAPAQDGEAKTKVKHAAEKVIEAAAQAEAAAQSIMTSPQILGSVGAGRGLRSLETMNADEQTFVRGLVAAGDDAAQKAAAAKAKAEEAKDEVSKGSSLSDIANTVAGKLPLVGGAFIFAVLGAWVSDFIAITFQ